MDVSQVRENSVSTSDEINPIEWVNGALSDFEIEYYRNVAQKKTD